MCCCNKIKLKICQITLAVASGLVLVSLSEKYEVDGFKNDSIIENYFNLLPYAVYRSKQHQKPFLLT
jgi:hypothetical protein